VTSSVGGSVTLTHGGNSSTTFSGIIQNGSGAVALTKAGTGSLSLTGANTYTGITTVSAGTLSIGSGSTTGSISNSSNVTNNGTLTFNRSNTYTYSGIISGTGAVTKSGAGTLTLSGTNTYTGATSISEGTLRLGAANAVPNTSNVILGGGTLSTGATTGFNETAGTLLLSVDATIALGTGLHSLNFANSSLESWDGAATLTITGWTGTAGASGTAGKIFAGTGGTGLTPAQLAQINFDGYPDGATLLSTGEVVPFSPSILPVNITWVSATKVQGNVKVSWNSATEAGLKYYEVEHSNNGREFVKLGRVTARNVNGASYDFIHQQPGTGNHYYRLRSEDADGKNTTSQIVKISLGEIKPGIVIYPNVVNTSNRITLQLNALNSGKYQIKLTDMAGRVLMAQLLEHNGNASAQTITLPASLSAGKYLLHIIGNEKSFTESLMKF
jgi:autotransporter-associated beta strand protein